jgi:hypothetical protein
LAVVSVVVARLSGPSADNACENDDSDNDFTNKDTSPLVNDSVPD